MKTSYKDFYDYYKSVESANHNIESLKKSISNNYKNWADLELALGQYTSELETLEDFDQVFEDIGEHLSIYLKKEESLFDLNKVNQNNFFENLVNPENFLFPADKSKISIFKNKFSTDNWIIDIVTFNYTRVIDRIIGEKRNTNIGHHLNSKLSVSIRSIDHIHGYLDERMVLGVNDLTQLKNKDFHENEDVIEAIVKGKCNLAYRHNIDNQFKARILKANLICVFGSSIGDTDNIWWELIGERLKGGIPIIIFTKGEEVISPRIGYKNNRTERKMRTYFLNKDTIPITV